MTDTQVMHLAQLVVAVCLFLYVAIVCVALKVPKVQRAIMLVTLAVVPLASLCNGKVDPTPTPVTIGPDLSKCTFVPSPDSQGGYYDCSDQGY